MDIGHMQTRNSIGIVMTKLNNFNLIIDIDDMAMILVIKKP